MAQKQNSKIAEESQETQNWLAFASVRTRETHDETVVPATVRWGVLGAILGVGAPAGWLAFRLFFGGSLQKEISSNILLYIYLLVGTVAAFGIFGFLLGKRQVRMRGLVDKFADQSATDALTGLTNSGFFYSKLEEEVSRHVRQSATLSLLIVDIDHFKDINDEWGHAAGNRVLRRIGETIPKIIRDYDIAGRIGGEEFAILLPKTYESEARSVALRIKDAVGELEFSAQSGKGSFDVTVSIGISTAEVTDNLESNTFFRCADDALYRAKKAGRNTVKSASYPERQALLECEAVSGTGVR